MKRIKAACLYQTLIFMAKEDTPHDISVRQVKQEVEQYKNGLERNRTKYKIVSETVQPNGSIELKIIKQYNSSPVGQYLD